MKVMKSLLLLGILGMLFLQVSCTTDSPVDPAANRPPDTFITNFTVAAIANDDGSYSLSIPTNRGGGHYCTGYHEYYQLHLNASLYSHTLENGGYFFTTARNYNYDFFMHRAEFTISGYVRNSETGEGIEGAEITSIFAQRTPRYPLYAYDEVFSARKTLISNDDGSYSLCIPFPTKPKPPDDYYHVSIVASLNGYTLENPGAIDTTARYWDYNLFMHPSYIEGVLAYADGEGITGVRVALYSAHDLLMTTTSKREGKYRFCVNDGTYSVVADDTYMSGFYFDPEYREVTIKRNDAIGVNFGPVFSISGRVMDIIGNTGIKEVAIRVRNSDGTIDVSTDTTYGGYYSITGLPGDSYNIEIDSPSNYVFEPGLSHSATVNVFDSDVNGVDFCC